MVKGKEDHDRVTTWMRRIARIWSVPLILYALFMGVGYGWSWATTGVADPYAVEEVSFLEALPPISLFLGIMGLGVAWRWERLGGAITLVFSLAALIILIFQRSFTGDFFFALMPFLLVIGVAIPGVLFLICGYEKEN